MTLFCLAGACHTLPEQVVTTTGFVVRSFTVGDTTTSCSCASVGYIGIVSLGGTAVSLDACV